MSEALRIPFDSHPISGLVRRGVSLDALTHRPVLATGIDALDACLPGGGLPADRVTEVTGRRASGKLSLALGIAASVLGHGDAAVLVDPSASIVPDVRRHPVLADLLVVRGGGIGAALRAVDALLERAVFPLVVLDLPGRGRGSVPDFLRLAREARASGTAVLLVSEWLPWRPNGADSLVGLRLEVHRARRGALEVAIVKSKIGNEGTRVVLDPPCASPAS